MSGIYVHIPFCKKACHYCNFHFSTSLKSKNELLEALHIELQLQRDYLQGQVLQSVYLGGGTPSILETGELEQLFEQIAAIHTIAPDAEITLEANPDDLSAEKLADLRRYTPVNRLSIGIQSVHDKDLQWMNRAHNSAESRQALELALNAGFQDLSIDLIYGIPGSSDADWAENVALALQYPIPHISCYCLTVEEGTALHHFVKKGKAVPVDEAAAARQFEYLCQTLAGAGYEHYEISNFALPGRYARHNSSYWQGAHYLGIGPSAHSFNGISRQWNVSNNALYIKALQSRNLPFEIEILTPEQRYNEYVMTGLRTIWGCDTAKIAALGASFLPYFEEQAKTWIAQGHLYKAENIYRLSASGKLLADGIAAALFVD